MKKTRLLFAVSFLQGGCIMGYEILVPKLIAPFFGGSVYVWASSLIFSMLGLTTGYFVAGRFADKQPLALARNVLAMAGSFILLITLASPILNEFLLEIPLRQGIVLSSFMHLFPVFVCLGMISPLIISILSTFTGEASGKAAGRIFATSTVAGIVFSMITGFYLIPEQGIFSTAIVLTFCSFLASTILHTLRSSEPLITAK